MRPIPRAAKDSVRTALADPRPTARVVIVDDDPHIRKLLKRLLDRAGLEVVGEADGGAKGAQVASELQPDIVILDSQMPGLNGEGAAPLIREGATGAKIVAYSGGLQSCPGWADFYLNKASTGMFENMLAALAI